MKKKARNNDNRESNSLFLLEENQVKQLNVYVNDVNLDKMHINVLIDDIRYDGNKTVMLDEKAMNLYEFEEYWFSFTDENRNHVLHVDDLLKRQLKKFFSFNILEVF